MQRYIIAARFGHAFVCRAWVSKAKAHQGRRYGIAKNWSCLEAQAIAEVQQRAGAWPVHGFYPCSPALAAQAVYIMRAYHTRTQVRRMQQSSAPGHVLCFPEEGEVVIFALSLFGRPRYQLHRATAWKDNELLTARAENWRELEAPAREAILTTFGTLERIDAMTCPPELAALARWPEAKQEE